MWVRFAEIILIAKYKHDRDLTLGTVQCTTQRVYSNRDLFKTLTP